MAEDSSDDHSDMEDRMYALLHYVDGSDQHSAQINTQANLNPIIPPFENGIRRYWKSPSQYKKSYKKSGNVSAHARPVKVEPLNHNLKITSVLIEIEETQSAPNVTVLESSEDEVVEVELPQQPPITIESSSEDDVVPIVDQKQEKKEKVKKKKRKNKHREVASSPVPSVVSSVSDDFIRNDCVAFNITSKQKETQKFDFNLHGTDLADSTLNNDFSNIKKRKKDKSRKLSTPKSSDTLTPDNRTDTVIFAAPENKQKNKKKRKYLVTDICESDSSQSMPSDITKNTVKHAEEIVTNDNSVDKIIDVISNQIIEEEIEDKSSIDIQSNQINSVTKTDIKIDELKTQVEDDVIYEDKKPDEKSTIIDLSLSDEICSSKLTVDLTGKDEHIETDIVMGNVSFPDPNQLQSLPFHEIVEPSYDTKVVYKPAILQQNLDFNDVNLCEIASPNSLKYEMKRFYTESWGGEDFDHEEVKRAMSRDKSLWQIDKRDRMIPGKRLQRCSHCQGNHREEHCYRRPKICYMCGQGGHLEPRCPNKMCVNCGTPNNIYTAKCRSCFSWPQMFCNECKRRGHPSNHCPDLWRRYHYTVDHTEQLIEERDEKHGNKAHCSGCAQTGHLVHRCNNYINFTTLPIFNPFVNNYSPVYLPSQYTVATKNTMDDQPNTSNFKRNDTRRAFESPQNMPTMNTKVNIHPSIQKESNSNIFNRGESNVRIDPTKLRPLMDFDQFQRQHPGYAFPEKPTQKPFDSRKPYHAENVIRTENQNFGNNRPYRNDSHFQNNSPYNKREPQSRFLEEVQSSNPSKRYDNKTVNQAGNDRFGEYPPIQIVVNNNFNEMPNPNRLNEGSVRTQIDRSSNFAHQNSQNRDGNAQFNERHKRTISETSGRSEERKRRRTTSPPNQSSIVDSTSSSPEKVNDSDRGHYTGLIFVEDSVLNALNTPAGKRWLKAKCEQFDLSVIVKSDPVPALEVKGPTRNHEIFQTELRKWSGWKNKNENAMTSPLSKNKKNTLERIKQDLNKLQNVKFNARQLKSDYAYNYEHHNRLIHKKNVSKTKLMNSRRRINRCNKSINMLLLGQAGLANGHQHLRRLISLKENLQKVPGDTVPATLLQDLQKGYEPIFGLKPRNDYDLLFKEYHAKQNNFKKFIDIMRINTSKSVEVNEMIQDDKANTKINVVRQAPDSHLRELKQWHGKLLNTFVKQKKTRNKLLRQIVDAIKKWPLLGSEEHNYILNEVKLFLKK